MYYYASRRHSPLRSSIISDVIVISTTVATNSTAATGSVVVTEVPIS